MAAQIFLIAAFAIPGAFLLLLAVAGTAFGLGFDTPDRKERAEYMWMAVFMYFFGSLLMAAAAYTAG